MGFSRQEYWSGVPLSSPSKPLNYGKLADIEQEEKEAPGKFLDRLSEPVVTEYLKTDLVHTPVLIAYSGYLKLTEREIYFLRSLFPLHFQDQSH